MKPLIIIGTGLAGYSVASEYRKLDATREIMMISGDDGVQYSKPMLSTALAQKKTASQLANSSAQDMAKRLNVAVIPHQRVLSLTPQSQTISTSMGEFSYGDLVLALGADPIPSKLQGDGADQILSVNDLADYSRLRVKLEGARQVLIIGGGLIGCEFANDLLAGGIVPIVVDPNPTPLAKLTPEAIGNSLKDELERAGVIWHLNTKVDRVDLNENRLTVTLASGLMLEVDGVISAIGLRPRTELAKVAGIATARGILVDAYGETSVPGIFALGDCAEYIDGRLMPYVRPTLIAARSIAATLAGTLTRIDFPVMPITVKTPTHPVVVLRPGLSVKGEWSVFRELDIEHWLFRDDDNRLHGFAVSGTSAKSHPTLTREVGSAYPKPPAA